MTVCYCKKEYAWTVPINIEQPYVCPKCKGQGKVQTPPWIAGDQETYVANSIELYNCPVCKGKGVLWR